MNGTLEHPKKKPPWVVLPGSVARWHPPFRGRVFMGFWRWCADAILDCKSFFCALLAATPQGARLLEPRGRSKPSTGPPVQAETWLSSRYRCCWYCRCCPVFGDSVCCCLPLLLLPSFDFQQRCAPLVRFSLPCSDVLCESPFCFASFVAESLHRVTFRVSLGLHMVLNLFTFGYKGEDPIPPTENPSFIGFV